MAGWAPIQQVSNTGLAVTTLVLTPAATKVGSDLVIDFAATDFNITSISGGGTWALDKSTGNGHLFSGTWRAKCNTSVTSVTITWGGSETQCAAVLSELPELAYSPVGATNAGSGISTTPDTGSETPLDAENINWAMVAHRGTYSSGPTGGFTGGIEAKTGTTAVRNAWLERHAKTAAQATWTLTGSVNWDTAITQYERATPVESYQTDELTDTVAAA